MGDGAVAHHQHRVGARLEFNGLMKTWRQDVRARQRGGGHSALEPGVERGMLIAAEDSADGGIDSEAVAQLTGDLFGA